LKLLDRMKYGLQRMLVGRNGVDRLSMTMIWAGFALLIIATFLGSNILSVLALTVYVLAIVRVFSKNTVKRSAENQFYLKKVNTVRNAIKHRRNRFKMRKQYRYFKCPECKSWLRLPRGAGKVKVTCGHCGHKFSYISNK